MFDSSLLKQLKMSLMLGTGGRSNDFKLHLNTFSRKSTEAHRTLSICVKSRAGFSVNLTQILT